MRLPNQYGSVYKLSGKRRKPWAVRKTVGWKQINEKMKSYPIYEFVGYYATRAEALKALAAFNENPYDLHANTLTFAELYNKWSAEHFEKVKETTGYKAAFGHCESIHDMKLTDIRLGHFQNCIDSSGKNNPTLKKIKTLLGLMYDYAVRNEILTPDKRELIRYIDITKAGNPNAYNRKPFTIKEIKQLWDAEKGNEYISTILMLIYTGLRIGELLELEKKNVHLEERWLYIKESKTNAGVREVPVAEKVVPFFERWMKRDCNYLICTPKDAPFKYSNYYDAYWIPLMLDLGMGKYVWDEEDKKDKYDGHRPHDTRHTCISLLTKAEVDKRIIKKIVGHKGQDITEDVYTHIDIACKLEAINRI